MNNLQRAKDAILAVFSDTDGKSAGDTYAELEELKEEIESCQNCLADE